MKQSTEARNERARHIDKMPLSQAIALINDETRTALDVIDSATAQIEAVCEVMIAAIARGNRILYIGAGTSGRLGIIDAAECPPTFGVDPSLFHGIIAGGYRCLVSPVEEAEDNYENGMKDLIAAGVRAGDVVIGISASGGAAYVLGAMAHAKAIGAIAVALVNNEDTKMERAADLAIVLPTGAEVIAGSTRMKAGTTQKIVLNMLSTLAMVHSGCVYENLMITLKPTNVKLRRRMIGIVCEILGCDEACAQERLEKNEWSIRRAIAVAD